MSRNYLMTGGTSLSEITSAFRLTYNYYQAKPRTILGVPTIGFIRDEYLERLDPPKKDKFTELSELFSGSTIKKQNRFYYACVDNPAPSFVELSEIYKQESKLVGSYTQVTETYNRGSIVPKDISYEEIPEVEYNRIGTGRFNFRNLLGGWDLEKDGDGTLSTQWERRLPMSSLGEYYTFEHHVFTIEGIIPNMEVLGKTYTSVMHTIDSIFEKKKDAADYGKLISLRHNFYAKKTGLIKSITYDEYDITPDDPTRLVNNMFNAGKNTGYYSVLLLLPSPNADAQKLLSGLNFYSDYKLLQAGIISESADINLKQTSSSGSQSPGNLSSTNQSTSKSSTPIALEGTIAADFVGYWVRPYPNFNSQQYSYDLKADGTYEYFENPVSSMPSEKGQWRISNNSILLKPEKEGTRSYKSKVAKNSKVDKDTINIAGTFYRSGKSEAKEFVSKMKPAQVLEFENKPLKGTIDPKLIGLWQTDGSDKTIQYDFKEDGTGQLTETDKQSKEVEKQQFNWRVNNGYLERQILCTTGNCPRGDKYIDRSLPVEFIMEKNKPALKIEYGIYMKK